MEVFTKDQVLRVMKEKGYTVFSGSDYDLNLIAVRANNSKSNDFDDRLYVLYRKDDKIEYRMESFAITTDPGKHWLLNPMNINGTLIMVPGRYPKAFKIGRHKDYIAFEQISSDIKYIRDNRKVGDLDLAATKDVSRHITGDFSTNIHRASKWRETLKVGKYSAGCQVIQSPTDFERLLELGRLQEKNGFGKTFTYTLLEEQDFKDG